MNIPHLKPVKFAQKILFTDKDEAKVQCQFPEIPTLAMFFEAAAQSSAAFSQEKAEMGFVISLKDIILHQSTDKLNVIVHIQKKAQINSICEFEFKIFCEKEKVHYSSGILTIMIKK